MMTECAFPESDKGIFDAILQGDIDFESEPWPSISVSAKDLVCKMLTKNPKERITPAQVLGKFHILLLTGKVYTNLSILTTRLN